MRLAGNSYSDGIFLTLSFLTPHNSFGWWNVGLGHLNRDNLQWHESIRAEINPNFDFNTLNNNLAIIFLTQPAVVSATIAPVSLPMLAQSPNPLPNENGRISGFGHTQSTGVFANDLQVSFQRVIENQECVTAWPHMANFIQNVFCAEAAQGQICAGDQGAGFVVDIFFQPVLFGVVSFGDQNCGQGHRAVFTRVNPYRDWIQQQTQIQWPN